MSNYFDEKTSFMEPIVTQYGSRMVMTNVVKAKTKKYINFDTRFSDYTDTEYSFNLPERISNVTQIKVSQIEIPVNFYNISSHLQNNFFRIKNVTENIYFPILIPDGNYSKETLIAKMQTLLPINRITFYIDSNNVCSFSNVSTSTTYLIDFSINANGIYCVDYLENSIKSCMGFKNINYTLNKNTSINAENVFNINTIRYLFLTMEDFVNSSSNDFTAMLRNSTLNKKILTRISLDNTLYSFGSVLHGELKLMDCVRKYHGSVDLQKIKMQLVNEFGTPIFLNGGHFSFCMEIEMEE